MIQRKKRCVLCAKLTLHKDELFQNYICPSCMESGAWGREIDRRIEICATTDLYFIMLKASKITGISLERLKSYSRVQTEVEARWLYMYLALKETKRSLSAIGRYCLKDHATVTNALKKIEQYKKTNRPFRERWNEWIISAT